MAHNRNNSKEAHMGHPPSFGDEDEGSEEGSSGDEGSVEVSKRLACHTHNILDFISNTQLAGSLLFSRTSRMKNNFLTPMLF